jgi:hypothetical protein
LLEKALKENERLNKDKKVQLVKGNYTKHFIKVYKTGNSLFLDKNLKFQVGELSGNKICLNVKYECIKQDCKIMKICLPQKERII